MKKIILVMSLVSMMQVFALAQPAALNTEPEQREVNIVENKPGANPVARLKAERNFLKQHKHADNIQWFDDNNGFFVYYKQNGRKGRSFYNGRGQLLYDVISYPGEFLSPQLKDMVKSVYYLDFRITHVSEIRTAGKLVHLIELTDDKSWKKLRVQDGVMELIKEYIII
ncbi:MAG TPA: hypothetical protein PLV32_05675 [Chitinophagaceae bacterium]|nr:hypothetical protein [Chitinophagaceae bacterium]